jgi:hypothetical protein
LFVHITILWLPVRHRDALDKMVHVAWLNSHVCTQLSHQLPTVAGSSSCCWCCMCASLAGCALLAVCNTDWMCAAIAWRLHLSMSCSACLRLKNGWSQFHSCCDRALFCLVQRAFLLHPPWWLSMASFA